MNPDIYDDSFKGEKHIEVEKHEPREFTKEELLELKEKIDKGIEETKAQMFFDDLVERYVTGSDNDRQEILDKLQEDYSEEAYSKMVELLASARENYLEQNGIGTK